MPTRIDSADLLHHVTADKAPLYRSVMDVFAAAKRQYRLQLRPDEVLSEANWPDSVPRIEEVKLILMQLAHVDQRRRSAPADDTCRPGRNIDATP